MGTRNHPSQRIDQEFLRGNRPSRKQWTPVHAGDGDSLKFKGTDFFIGWFAIENYLDADRAARLELPPFGDSRDARNAIVSAIEQYSGRWRSNSKRLHPPAIV